MDNPSRQLAMAAGLAVLVISALLLAHVSPGYFNNEIYLGGLILLQLLIAAVWNFRNVFFAFLMTTFVWAGVDLPMAEAWTSARWGVLLVGAVVGYVLFIHDRSRRFHAFHLVAFFSVAAAFVSALVSTYPKTAVLKAISLFMLFLWAGAGGRLAIHGREASFFRGLLVACEMVTAFTAVSYFIFHAQFWGNPNSLGLVMGVGIAPLLFWGSMVAETRPLRLRRSAAFYVSMILLFYSVSRASIMGGICAIAIVCIALRKHKLLLKGAMLAVFCVAVTAILAPDKLASFTDVSTSKVLYKDHRESGIVGSRKSPWQQTVNVISQHPWFGSGFGTSPSGREDNSEGIYSSNTDNSREHGSSYLAIVEWVGLVGIVPFAALLLLLVWKIGQALAWMSRTRCAEHPLVPIVLVLLGGFIHAAFEDWLFAVGYYFAVFFWTLAFALFDVVPVYAPKSSRMPEFLHPDVFDRVPGIPSRVQS